MEYQEQDDKGNIVPTLFLFCGLDSIAMESAVMMIQHTPFDLLEREMLAVPGLFVTCSSPSSSTSVAGSSPSSDSPSDLPFVLATDSLSTQPMVVVEDVVVAVEG
jgi:hypothetical protein